MRTISAKFSLTFLPKVLFPLKITISNDFKTPKRHFGVGIRSDRKSRHDTRPETDSALREVLLEFFWIPAM